MKTTAGSLALVGREPAAGRLRRQAASRGGRGDPGQDESQRVGELPLHPLHERLERARRPDAKSVRAGPQSRPDRAPARPWRSRQASAPSAVGTETDGSIVCPSSICGIVGIKPTVGLVSRTGIIPISHTQDTAGPMARTVTDAAILLGALAGADPDDRSRSPGRAKGRRTTRPSSIRTRSRAPGSASRARPASA